MKSSYVVGIISSLIFLWVEVTLAQSSVTLLEKKVQLETLISESLKSRISTSMDRDSFEVHVEVKMQEVEVKKPAPPPKIKEKELKTERDQSPIFSQIGIIETEDLIRRHERQIEDLEDRIERKRLRLDAEAQNETKFILNSIKVTVGLGAQYPDAYLEQVRIWLDKSMKAEFGKLVTTKVEKMKEKIEAPIKKEDESYYKKVKDLQNLIGFILFFFGMIVALLLLKFLPSRDAQELRKLQIATSANLGQQGSKSNEAKVPEISKQVHSVEQDNPLFQQTLKELKQKISSLSEQKTAEMKLLVSMWLDLGKDGCQKFACFVDSVVSNFERSSDLSDLIEKNALNFETQQTLRNVIEELKKMTTLEKINVYESVYWDLVSLQTLGAKSMQKPFSYLNSLQKDVLETTLVELDSKIKTVALLNMPPLYQEKIVKNLNLEAKQDLISESFKINELSAEEINLIDESLKFKVKMRPSQSSKVSIFKLIPQLFQSISVHEEIQILKKLSEQYPSQIIELRKEIPTLAFLNEWKDRAIQALIGPATQEEVLALLKICPEVQDRILQFCAPLVRTIVIDELKIKRISNGEAETKNLLSLKAKLVQLLNENQIRMSDLQNVGHDEKDAAA